MSVNIYINIGYRGIFRDYFCYFVKVTDIDFFEMYKKIVKLEGLFNLFFNCISVLILMFMYRIFIDLLCNVLYRVKLLMGDEECFI